MAKKKGLLLLAGAAAAAYALTQTNSGGTQSANVAEILPYNPNLQKGDKGEKGDKGDTGTTVLPTGLVKGTNSFTNVQTDETQVCTMSTNLTNGKRVLRETEKTGSKETMYYYDGTGYTPILEINCITGAVSKIGGGSFAALSDERMKKEITPFTSGLEKVLAIQPKKFKYKAVNGTPTENYPKSITDRQQYGVIAQELQTVCPEMVSTDEAGFLTVDLSNLSLLLINAVKEQQALIEGLTARIVALETANTPTA